MKPETISNARSSTPERCECGGPAICERCGRMLPDYYTTSLLEHIQKLEKLARKLATAWLNPATIDRTPEELDDTARELEELLK